MSFVCAPSHPLSRRRGAAMSVLEGQQFVVREPGSGTRSAMQQLLTEHGITPDIVMEMPSNETIKQAVMAGMGISFLSAHTFQLEAETGKLVVLDIIDMPKMLDWCVLHRRDSALTGVNEAFHDFIVDRGADIVACRHGR